MPWADPRTNFLFWNIKKKPLIHNIVRLVENHNVHVLMFAETAFQSDPALLKGALNAGPRPPGSETFSVVQESEKSKIHVFSCLKHPQWTRMVTQESYDVWSLTTDAGHSLFLAAVHFPPIQVDQGDGQRRTALELRTDLERVKTEAEKASGSLDPSPIIACGDFNANPFDPGIAGVYGLNASLSREIVERSGGIRTLHGQKYRYLYNPMWRLFSGMSDEPPVSSAHDHSPTVYGTYYNSSLKKSVDYYWYTLDQVLISLSLFSHFRDVELRVLTRDARHGGVPLVSSEGLPKKTTKNEDYSDHLPILFSVRL